MSLGAEDRANEEVDRAISFARAKGVSKVGEPYYFIDLILLDAGAASGDPRNFCISGIRELTPNPPRPDKNGAMEYTFEEDQGGYTRFRPGQDGQWRYPMWDDPDNYNRRFLATHWDDGFWEIEDPVLESMIYDIYNEIQAEIKNKKDNPIQKKLITLQAKYKSAKQEDKVGVMEQIQALITGHVNEIMPPVKRGLDKKKKRGKYRTQPTKEQLAIVKEPSEEGRPILNQKPRQSVVRVDE